MSDSDVIDFILFPVVFELLHPFEFIDRYNLVSLEFINNISRMDINSDQSDNSSSLEIREFTSDQIGKYLDLIDVSFEPVFKSKW